MLFVVFFISLMLIPAPSFAIIITEVQIEGERVDDDYIKLYNSSGEDVNISGYAIRKRSSTGSESSVRVVPQESIIKKEEYLIWASSRNDDFPEKAGAHISSKQYLSKNNSIAVINREGEVVDALSWGESENAYMVGEQFKENPEKGQTITRRKEDEYYVNTRNNTFDFYLYPPPSFPKIEGFFTDTTSVQRKNPFIIAIPISVLLGVIIVYLKKTMENVRT